MEQIEIQATDLRYLAQPTSAPGGSGSAQGDASHGHDYGHSSSHGNSHGNSHAGSIHHGSTSASHGSSSAHPSRPSHGPSQHLAHHPLPQPYAHHAHHAPAPYAPPHHPQHHHHPAPSAPAHSPYPRLPVADDRHHHASMSPRAYGGSPSNGYFGSPSATGRPPPPLLHAVSDGAPSHAGSPQLRNPYSPEPLHGHGSGSHYGHMSNSANSSSKGGASAPLPSALAPASHGNSASANNNNANSVAASTPGRAQSPASYTGGTPSGKRKQDDDESNPKQQRSKRNRYISIACNECKRRKIKCNGETPCQRCGNLNLSCLYSPNCCSNSFKDSDEYKQMNDKMHSLEEQLESILQTVNGLRQETQRLAPLHERIMHMPPSTVSPSPSASILSMGKPDLPPIRQPHAFRGGPTSTAFTVDVAKNTLHNMGYSGEAGEDPGGPVADESPHASPALAHSAHPSSLAHSFSRPTPNDPLWDLFDRNEMVRLCRIHEDEIGIMYPVVKIESIIEHAQSLSAWMESARKTNNNSTNGSNHGSNHGSSSESGFLWPPNYDDAMADIRTLTLKIIMCCALAVEEHGHSDKAIRLYDSIAATVDAKLMSEPSDLANLPFLALVAGFRFLSNDEVLAWRVMGQVARHCLEQGLHRVEGITKIADEQERRNAVNTFWSAYVLDRRWSFGTGLPYVLHDDKIDPNLPYPDEFPYLVAMITYSRLGAKIWALVDFFEPAIIRDVKREEFERLDQEILQWYESCPDAVKIRNFERELPLPSTPSYNLQRLQIWTRLRLNQIRIWLHTPVLHSASSINGHREQAQRIVDLAKDTIRYLYRLNNSSNLYRRIQVFYHQFLTSAIAVLFLASTHQPVQFSANCREEFYMAMNLVKDMSAKSWVSQRLWRTIRSLKAYAPRLGLQDDDTDTQYSTAAYLSGFNVHPKSQSGHDSTANSTANSAPPTVRPALAHSGSSSSASPSARTPAGTAAQPPQPPQSQQPPQQQEPKNGVLIQTEMTRIFEGFTHQPPAADTPGTDAPAGNASVASDRPVSADAAGEEVYETLKNMF